MEVLTDFEPEVNGFKFTNRFRGGDVVAELGRQDRLSELTGLRLPRTVRYLTDLASEPDFWGSFGLCGGMAWVALDRFSEGSILPDNDSIPSPKTDLFRELVGRQADSMRGSSLLERCLVWQMYPDRAPWWMFWSHGVERLTVQQEWPKLRVQLNSNIPSSLVLIRVGGIDSPGKHHQVVATGYRISDEGAVAIDLYDPNYPGQRPTISLDPRAQSVGQRQTTGERMRGFFVWSQGES